MTHHSGCWTFETNFYAFILQPLLYILHCDATIIPASRAQARPYSSSSGCGRQLLLHPPPPPSRSLAPLSLLQGGSRGCADRSTRCHGWNRGKRGLAKQAVAVLGWGRVLRNGTATTIVAPETGSKNKRTQAVRDDGDSHHEHSSRERGKLACAASACAPPPAFAEPCAPEARAPWPHPAWKQRRRRALCGLPATHVTH